MGARPDEKHYRLIVDATGVGRPIVELFQIADNRMPVSITFTGGEVAHQRDWSDYTVPRKVLVGALQIVLQSGRLATPTERAMPLVKVLLTEADNFDVSKLRRDARQKQSSDLDWRTAEHDDVLFSVMMPIWFGESHRPNPNTWQRQHGGGFAEGPGDPLSRMGQEERRPVHHNPFVTLRG